MRSRFSIARCCCAGCVSFTDDFNRADSSALGSSWNERSGDWKIEAGTLRINSPAAGNHATIEADPTPYPVPSESGFAVAAVVKSSAVDDELGLIHAWKDADNFLFVVLKVHSTAINATCKLYQRVGGVNTLLKSVSVSAATNVWHYLEVCRQHHDTGQFLTQHVVKLNGDVVINYWCDALTDAEHKPGVYVGATTGTPEWDDVEVVQLNSGAGPDETDTSGCPKCVRCGCPTDQCPRQWAVDMGAWSGSCSPGPGSCDTAAGTYVLNRLANECGSDFLDVSNFTCAASAQMWLQYVLPSASAPDGVTLQVWIQHSNLNENTVYQKTGIHGQCVGVVHTLSLSLHTGGPCTPPATITVTGIA